MSNVLRSHLQVLACAGSGKTELIAGRVTALVAGGAAPESIVAFTFSERAAAELRDRIARRVREQVGREALDRLAPMFVGTIHSYCFRLLQTHVPAYGNHDVLDDHRLAGLLSREHRRIGLNKLGPKHWQPIRDFAQTVDVIANELIPAERLDGAPLGECYRAYIAMLEGYRFLTFGQLIALAVEQLQRPDVFARVHAPLRHLFVDEYQDVNPAQERLIELLAADPVRLCVVGDDDQSIYQWRGADVSNIIGFTTRYPDAATQKLETNHRSRPAILAAANAFAATIQPRLAKEMRPHRPAGDVELVPWSAATPEEEAGRIAETIQQLREVGFAYREIAVLFRSVRTSAPPLVDALAVRRVPFHCGGRTGLFLQPDIALFGEIHAWIADGQWRDSRYGEFRPVEVDAIAAGLRRQFEQELPGLEKYLADWKKDRLSNARSVSLVGDYYQFLRCLGAHRLDADAPEASARLGAFARFSQVLGDFEHVTRRGRYVDEDGRRVFRGGADRGKPYARQLYNYLLHYARDAYEEFEGETTSDLDAVSILTVHQAKGLEWPVVFMPALVDGRFPSRRAGQAQTWLLPDDVFPPTTRERYEGSETEERRLFYVGLTRARDCLYLSYFERKINEFRPSRFLVEVCGGRMPPHATLPRPHREGPPAKDPPPLRVSFSEVAAFDECGYRYRLATALGYQKELAVELGYGKAIHHVLRNLAETARLLGREPTPDEITRLLEDDFYLPFANHPTFERMRASAARLIARYLADYREDLGRVWATERAFELHLEDGSVSGRADVILGSPEGTPNLLDVVDYKTTADTRRDAAYALQLAVYAAAARAEGLTVGGAHLHDLNAGERRPVDVTAPAVVEAVAQIAVNLQGIRQGAFVPKPEPGKCGNCDYRQVCRHAPATAL